MINTILESFDIWTRSQTIKSNGRTAGVDNQRLLGIDKLRELILELAVRGKLVPQDEKDEPATTILQELFNKRKKENREWKATRLISESEKSFDLPINWEWFRIGDCFDFEYGKALVAKDRAQSGNVDVYGSNGIIGKHSESLVSCPCIIIGRKGSAGALNKAVNPSWTTDVAYYLVPPSGFNLDFTFYLLKSLNLDKIGKGIKPGINRNEVYQLVSALPPLAEQHRIVAKVDELMALCDQLEQQQTESNATHHQLVELLLQNLTEASGPETFATAWQRIATNFDTLFTTEYSIDQLKQTILQLAVMGKLVPQDPQDEPASELLKKIAKEKERLEKEGKIKKQEKLPEITDEEKPFELPRGWEWVRIGNLFDVTSSKRIHVSDYVDEGIPFFRSKEIGELGRGEEIKTAIFISKEKFEILKDLPGFPQKNDLMLASIGASIGNNWICDGRMFYYKDGNITKISSHEFANMRYLQIFISSPLLSTYFSEGVAGSAYNALTIVKIKDLLYPLPPLAEQHRIVAKVDELFELCDALKERIKEAQETQGKLAEGVVDGVLG